jgi:uncharacterized protein (DUF427 family)
MFSWDIAPGLLPRPAEHRPSVASVGVATRVSESLPKDLRFEPTPKWVRAELAGETVIDTRSALLVWDEGRVVPGYAVPEEDLHTELVPDDALKRWHDPDLKGYVGVDFRAMDRWLEEEEEVFGHARDPFKRIDIRTSSRHVVVKLNGEIVADTKRPVLLFETGLPVRYYLPREDVRMDLLEGSDLRTTCAYKGHAPHFHAQAGDERHENIAWTYREPLPDHMEIKELISFYNERAEIEVDGEPADKPETQWSKASGVGSPPP